METEKAKIRCQRIGCDAFFTEDDNPDDSCQYHSGLHCEDCETARLGFGLSTIHLFPISIRKVSWPKESFSVNPRVYKLRFAQDDGISLPLLVSARTSQKPPIFHDGGKEWGCCKQRSHDFSLFLAIPGCKKGKHTSEKPQTKAAPSPNKPVNLTTTGNTALDAAKAACARCRQGFFCSDHGSQVGVLNSVSYRSVPESAAKPKSDFVPKSEKIIDLNQKQVCKNKGCGKDFTERDNHETACLYHPGPAAFHDRLRGWQCCDVHVKEFDEFLTIPPCTKGWHNANPDS